MKTIRWGIIGCGDVTEVKSGPGFQQASNSSLVAVMRRTGELARDYAQRHAVPRWYDNAEALIRDAVCEFCNLVVGTAASAIADYGHHLDFEAPEYVDKAAGGLMIEGAHWVFQTPWGHGHVLID